MQELLKAMEDISLSSEAARAGEAGRGFAVVAGEVSHLAEQSAAAVDASATISEETAASCDLLNENAENLRVAMSKFNLRKREPGKAYIPPEKQGDTEFAREAQRNYDEAVRAGRV